jgi:hypothetical protein
MRASLLAFAAIAAITGCADPGAYICAVDADCGANGHCEADLHCSVDDGSCESGRRYVAAAGDNAGTCTDSSMPMPMPIDEYGLCGVTAATPDPDGACAQLVCADEPACCTVGWDAQCARTAQARCDLGCEMVVAAGGFTTGSIFRTGTVATPLFSIPHNHWNFAMAWGDIEGNGTSDLAVARYVGDGTDGIVIYQSDGVANDQLVMTPVTITGAVGSVETVEWRDFDADGDLDLLATGSSGIYLVVTDGSTFTAHHLATAAAYAVWVDHDGEAPWRIATFLHGKGASDVSIREVTLDAGVYTMSTGTSLGLQEGGRLTWCNVAGSPERDLITGDRVRVANATGFAAPMLLGAGGYFPQCADLDGDGDNDIVLGSYDKASIVLNQAGLSMVPFVVPAISVGGIAIGDFDKNGRLDVVLSNNTNERVDVPLVLVESFTTGFASRDLPDWNTSEWDSYGLDAGPLPRSP